MARDIVVEVAYADPTRECVLSLRVPLGTSAETAARTCGLLETFSLNPETIDLGVFGRAVPRDFALRDGDRVEIYRPLKVDPKEARRRRAEVAKRC